MVEEYPEVGIQLEAVTRRLGIDSERLSGSIMLDALRLTCIECNARKQCAEWLRTAPREDDRAFCANAQLLDWLGGNRSFAFAATWW